MWSHYFSITPGTQREGERECERERESVKEREREREREREMEVGGNERMTKSRWLTGFQESIAKMIRRIIVYDWLILTLFQPA